MGLLSYFKRQASDAPATAGASAQMVADARTRAKRRLLGAVVLLGIGVIAFPLLFETQPRPIPVDIAIEIPRKDAVPPLAVPPARTAPAAAASKPAPALAVITETRAEAAKDIPAAAQPKAEPTPKAAQAAPKAAVAPTMEPKPSPPAARPTAEAPGRFVVQIGAFADSNVARDTRAKVEKLGLRTYTQAVDTEGGRGRGVWLGPFASRDEAEQSAAKVKAAGLPAVVLTL